MAARAAGDDDDDDAEEGDDGDDDEEDEEEDEDEDEDEEAAAAAAAVTAAVAAAAAFLLFIPVLIACTVSLHSTAIPYVRRPICLHPHNGISESTAAAQSVLAEGRSRLSSTIWNRWVRGKRRTRLSCA